MAIEIKNVSYIYNAGSPIAHQALFDISASLPTHKVSALVGETGSGKSTLVQHFNGLMLPTSGSLIIDGFEITSQSKPKGLKSLRTKVGFVFQFPEMQLFEETVLKDVMFGPKNFGFTPQEAEAKAKHALELVGLASEFWERSPMDLSGGQKRRVAIAGVLASDPSILVLDEPTAGLDPQGAQDMMSLFMDLHQNHQVTLIMVTHDMEDVYQYADHVVALQKGNVFFEGSTQAFFEGAYEAMGFLAPRALELRQLMIQKGIDVGNHYEVDALIALLKREVK